MAVVLSVQAFSISLGASDSSATATISSVTTSQAHIITHGNNQVSSITGDGSDADIALVLTNATTVTASRVVTGQATVVYGTVVEYDTGIVASIQTGSISIVGASTLTNTGAITSVDTTRAAVFHNGMTGSGNSGVEYNYLTAVYFSSISGGASAEITAERGAQSSSTAEAITYFTVVEYASGVADVQQVSATISASTSGTSSAFTAVDLSRSFLAWGGFHTTTSNDPGCYQGLQLTSTTQITATSQESQTGTGWAGVVQFASGYIDSVYRGTINLTQSVTSNTTSITSVTLSRTMANMPGWWTGGDEPDEAFLALTLDDTTTVRATRGSTGSLASDEGNLSYEIVQWAANQPVGGAAFVPRVMFY